MLYICIVLFLILFFDRIDFKKLLHYYIMYNMRIYFIIKSFILLAFLMDCLFILFKNFNFRLTTGFGLYKFSVPSAGHDVLVWVVTKLVSEPRFRDV